MASTYLSLHVHVIFATYGRAPMIDPSWRDELHGYLAGSVRGLDGTSIAVGGVADHVHMLARLKATHCIADFVREVKKSSSVWASEKYEPFKWQAGYAAFSLSARDVRDVKSYIHHQAEHHLKLSSADELKAILEEFEVEYDLKYFE